MLLPYSLVAESNIHLLVAALRRPLWFFRMRLIVVVLVLVVAVVVSNAVSTKQL